jgi:hypothetical protein
LIVSFWVLDLEDETSSLKVNVWNWRPTLVLLERFRVLEPEMIERMGFNGGSGSATKAEARAIARELKPLLGLIGEGDRVLLDGSTTGQPDDFVFHRDDLEKNYGATREWLEKFMVFCEHCQGFQVL